jgi:hypothetical protein
MRVSLASTLACFVVASRAFAAPAAPSPELKKAVPFIEDDYKRALAEARAKKRPLFIEAWAPW